MHGSYTRGVHIVFRQSDGVAITTAGTTIEKFVVEQPEEWFKQLTEKTGLQHLPL